MLKCLHVNVSQFSYKTLIHATILMEFLHSFSEPVSIILSSQVAVAKDDDFASLALKTRPVSINFRVNIKTNVSANESLYRSL